MVALDLAQVHAQVVTQLAELSFAGVLKAELEGCRKKKACLHIGLTVAACEKLIFCNSI